MVLAFSLDPYDTVLTTNTYLITDGVDYVLIQGSSLIFRRDVANFSKVGYRYEIVDPFNYTDEVNIRGEFLACQLGFNACFWFDGRGAVVQRSTAKYGLRESLKHGTVIDYDTFLRRLVFEG